MCMCIDSCSVHQHVHTGCSTFVITVYLYDITYECKLLIIILKGDNGVPVDSHKPRALVEIMISLLTLWFK